MRGMTIITLDLCVSFVQMFCANVCWSLFISFHLTTTTTRAAKTQAAVLCVVLCKKEDEESTVG